MTQSKPINIRLPPEQFEKLEAVAKISKLSSPHLAARQILLTALSGDPLNGSSHHSFNHELMTIQAEIQHLSLSVQMLVESYERLAVFWGELTLLLLINIGGIGTEEASTTIAQLFKGSFGEDK